MTTETDEPRGLAHTTFDTDLRRDAYLDLVREKITEHGWIVQAVGALESEPPFAYTVGLAAYGHPEIVIVGLPFETMQDLLNIAGRQVRDGERFTPGPYERILIDYPIWMISCDKENTRYRLTIATAIHGGPVDALQLVWPDANRRFPWDDGYDQDLAVAQPVLGPTP